MKNDLPVLMKLAEFVHSLRLADIPNRVVDKARLQQASVIAAALGSRLDRGAQKVERGVARRGDSGDARLLASGARATVHGAVLANAAASCAFDWDEVVLIGHPGHSAVCVPLALSEAHGAALEDVLVAQVAANEVGARLGLACFFGPQNGQHLPFIHHIGAAAAASKILGLTLEQTAHALAIALAQPQTALWPAFLGPIESKVLTAAHPAEIGLSAAEHAGAGLRGPHQILDHHRGFFSRFSFLPVREALGGLGSTWLTDTMQIKTHAACWYYQTALDAAAALLAERGRPFAPGDIAQIAVRTNFLAVGVHGSAQQGRTKLLPNVVNFRLDLSLAVMLTQGAISPAELDARVLEAREPDIRRVARKISVEHDLELSRGTVASVDRALDLQGLLGQHGPLEIGKALGKMRAEFTSVPGPKLSELLPLLGQAGGVVQALSRSLRKRPYDLSTRADAVAEARVENGSRLEIQLTTGDWLRAEALVPVGCLNQGPSARRQTEDKLRHAVRLAGGGDADAEGAVQALLSSPLSSPAGEVLDQMLGFLPPTRAGD